MSSKRIRISFQDILREFIEDGGVPFLDGTERNISTAKYLINTGHTDPRLRLSFDKDYVMNENDIDDFMTFLYEQYIKYQKNILLAHFFGMRGEYPIEPRKEEDFEQEIKEIDGCMDIDQ